MLESPPSKPPTKIIRRLSYETKQAGTKLGVFLKSPQGGTLCFIVSISYITAALIILTGYPEWYWLFHNGFVFFLVALRFVYYKAKGWHYYLFEFCYFCNYWLVLLNALSLLRWYGKGTTFLSEYHEELMRSYFLLAEGPLLWSVMTFKNSMVFHNFDQMISLWLHLSPALVGWTFRWYDDEIEKTFPGLFQFDVGGPMDYRPNFFRTVVLYLALWLIPYYLFMFRIGSHRIKERGYDTLFHYMTRPGGLLAGPLGKYEERTRSKVYCLIHFVGSLVSANIAFIWWHYYVAHTVFLFFNYLLAAYNGATYYYTAFVRQNTKSKKANISMNTLIEATNADNEMTDENID